MSSVESGQAGGLKYTASTPCGWSSGRALPGLVSNWNARDISAKAREYDVPWGANVICGHPGETQLTEIPGQGGLGDIPAALEEKLAQILLTAHHPGVDDLEDRVVSFALVGHAVSLAWRERMREARSPDH